MALTIKKEAWHIVLWQFILIAGLAMIVLLLQGFHSGISAFIGSMAYWLPTVLFVWRVFARASGARVAKQFLLMFVAGEGIKLLLSAVLFVLIVNYLPVNLLAVLIGFVGAVAAFWLASIVFIAKREGMSG